MASKDLLLVIPSTEVAPFVDSILRPGVENDFAEIVVGLDFAAFEAALAQHDRMVIACGMFVPNLKEIIAEIVGKSPRAKPVWIHSFSAGVDHLLTPEVKGSGAPVTNAKGCFSHSLAEYVLCGCMYFDKEITRLQANRTAAKWERFQMGELMGQTMGVVGYGDIGQTTARLAKAFRMKVLAYRRTEGHADDGVAKYCAGEEGLDYLLRTSDFVVAAMPGTPATRHFINAERIGKMKPSAVFVNVGRGTCVDEAALCDALKRKAIKGACLDVFEKEPLVAESPLWGLDNVLLSPHNADNTRSYYPSTMERFVELTVNFYLKGRPFPETVDLDQGY